MITLVINGDSNIGCLSPKTMLLTANQTTSQLEYGELNPLEKRRKKTKLCESRSPENGKPEK